MVSGLAVKRRVTWDRTWRIIRSIWPPVDLFEDIADPRDWDALASVEAKTNPRIRNEVGDLGKVPAARRVGGPGASLLFGTPGQQRFWFMWDDLVRGAIGAVVIADTRRLADSFAPVDFFEDRGLPYIVGVNTFDGILQHDLNDVREALSIDPSIPIVRCDARDRESTKQTLITLVEYAMRKWIALRAANSAS